MATITGLTAARMLAIEGSSVISGQVVGGNLILTKHDGTTVNAGPVVGPAGAAGPAGPAGSSNSGIPGEVKLWSGSALPSVGTYGKWVWADGAVYVVATYPIAAGHIAAAWRTFGGASDPGVLNFRVPDLRGLVPAGLDQMPGGARANRMTRAVAITLAGRAGEETHVITLPEMASHAHGGGDHGHNITDNGHHHQLRGGVRGSGGYNQVDIGLDYNYLESIAEDGSVVTAQTGITINGSGGIITAEGGNGAHENVQPTVFVPWIVKLDG